MGKERDFGLMYENKAVDMNKEKTAKCGLQVEKALYLPSTDGIFSTAEII